MLVSKLTLSMRSTCTGTALSFLITILHLNCAPNTIFFCVNCVQADLKTIFDLSSLPAERTKLQVVQVHTQFNCRITSTNTLSQNATQSSNVLKLTESNLNEILNAHTYTHMYVYSSIYICIYVFI